MSINYMPGDNTIHLIKAELRSLEGAKPPPIKCYFNPATITIDKQVPWQEHKNSEDDLPSLEFTSGAAKTLNVELLFDMFEAKGDVYETYVTQLEDLVLMDPELKRPPMCVFSWGKMRAFQGVVEDLNVKYTLFLPDGTPCRATVGVKMKELKTFWNKKSAGADKHHNGTQAKGVIAPAGQRIDHTADAVGDKSYRDTASRNGIDDPANPPSQIYRGPNRT
jgi:Contractile injection system tube protein